MFPDTLIVAGPVIATHVVAASVAVILGPVALFRRSRDVWHRMAGVVWVVAMFVVAGSSLFISEGRMFGAFSIIHVLSVLTLVGLAQGLWALYRGQTQVHGRIMRALYIQALIIAGVFTFLPGRRMSGMLFGSAPMAGFLVVAGLGLAAALFIWRDGRRVQ